MRLYHVLNNLTHTYYSQQQQVIPKRVCDPHTNSNHEFLIPSCFFTPVFAPLPD